MKLSRDRKKPIWRYILIGSLALLVIGICVYIFLRQSTPARQSKDPDATSQTTSKQPSAQSDFRGAAQKEIAKPIEKEEGIVNDTNSNVQSTPPSSSWTSSPSGVVTVFSPAKESILKSGSFLAGKASAERVQFRLIDDAVGVIAQGSLSVVDGKFSGTFSFSTSAKTGRVDVFTATEDGVETNVVEIPVRFS